MTLPERALEGYLRVDVSGKDPNMWTSLKAKLLARVSAVLDSSFSHERGTSIREELNTIKVSLLEAAHAKLKRPGVEIDRIEADIAKTYAEQRREIAEAEKLEAEAAQIRNKNAVYELRTALSATSAMLIGDEDAQAILFGRQIDKLLALLKELDSS